MKFEINTASLRSVQNSLAQLKKEDWVKNDTKIVFKKDNNTNTFYATKAPSGMRLPCFNYANDKLANRLEELTQDSDIIHNVLNKSSCCCGVNYKRGATIDELKEMVDTGPLPIAPSMHNVFSETGIARFEHRRTLYDTDTVKSEFQTKFDALAKKDNTLINDPMTAKTLNVLHDVQSHRNDESTQNTRRMLTDQALRRVTDGDSVAAVTIHELDEVLAARKDSVDIEIFAHGFNRQGKTNYYNDPQKMQSLGSKMTGQQFAIDTGLNKLEASKVKNIKLLVCHAAFGFAQDFQAELKRDEDDKPPVVRAPYGGVKVSKKLFTKGEIVITPNDDNDRAGLRNAENSPRFMQFDDGVMSDPDREHQESMLFGSLDTYGGGGYQNVSYLVESDSN